MTQGGGIFCGNSSYVRGVFARYRKAWCGTCFTPLDGDPYPAKRQIDEDGEELEVADKSRFEVGMNGAHLTIPLQCELCHFRNIYGRNPRANRHQDVYAMITMRRANLDAMWAREPSTVAANLREWKRVERTREDKFGFPNGVCKSMGPFPLEDTMGMKLACCLLDRSLDPGNNEERIQFSTMRRMRSAYSNAYAASYHMRGAILSLPREITNCSKRSANRMVCGSGGS